MNQTSALSPVTEDYGAAQIQILEGLEAVRKRPSMYIGSTSSQGLHHMVYEIVDNAVDEALAGHCTLIQVYLNKDGSVTVRDNGRGIPAGIQTKTGLSAIQVVFTVLHAGGKFDDSNYKVSGGLHGVGASVVNALSSHLHVQVDQDGFSYAQSYERGIPAAPVKQLGQEYSGGTAPGDSVPDTGSGDIPVRFAEGPGRRGNLSGDRLVPYLLFPERA